MLVEPMTKFSVITHVLNGVDLFIKRRIDDRFLIFRHAEDLLPRNVLREQKIKKNPYHRNQKQYHDPC